MQVYKASYLDCDIAVKKLNRINDAKSEEAFRRECAILKGCRHPHIVNFMGVSKDEVGSSAPCPFPDCSLPHQSEQDDDTCIAAGRIGEAIFVMSSLDCCA